ncbi:MAG: hypothetical protein IJI05_00090 [Erysipelotrichaceae bacterium]|nr:hypothetical protein [Erysipelotrichaceae bacterium]
MKKLKYIFVHGLNGWGSYDRQYEKMPYWGMRKGDLIRKLRQESYDCYAASVDPKGSAYDRACELYAQLAGTLTDYGKNHAAACGHPQYGPDFTGRSLIDDFEDSSLVLIGHSFGGATIRLFAHMMAYGNPEEPDGDLPLFAGGMSDRIYGLVAIAAPHNGTTAYDLYEDPDFDLSAIRTTMKERFMNRMMSRANSMADLERSMDDVAAYDMHIDNAMKLNERIRMLPDAYYFSQPCCATERKGNVCVPVTGMMEPLYTRSAKYMGAYKGKTTGGFVIDESWQENDGLVNTVSAAYPLSDSYRMFDASDIQKGIWNVFDTYRGDHMALQGGMFMSHDIYPYYFKLLQMIESLD